MKKSSLSRYSYPSFQSGADEAKEPANPHSGLEGGLLASVDT